MTPPDDATEADLDRYSDKPFTPEEWKRFRRDMSHIERLKPLLNAYERGSTITGFLMTIGAYLIGGTIAIVGFLQGLAALGWWPFKGHP